MIILGGPAYELRVDARHCDTIAGVAALLARRGISHVIEHEHATPVAMARNNIMRRALDSGATQLVQLDADVYGDPRAIVAAIAEQRRLAATAPLILIPVELRRGDGLYNVSFDGERWSREIERAPCKFGGLGAAVYYLPAYREHWSAPPWYLDVWLNGELAPEDRYHTERITDYLGQPPLCWGSSLQHAPRGQR